MKIHCHTNLDLNNNEKWPKELPCRPMVGDILTSSTGLELQVVRVVFPYQRQVSDYSGDDYRRFSGPPDIQVELHLVPSRFENISAFEKWYKNRT